MDPGSSHLEWRLLSWILGFELGLQLSWGVAHPTFRRQFRKLIKEHNPSIIALFETHTSGANSDKIIKSFGFDNSFRVEAQGFSRGIWILWNTSVEVKITKVAPLFSFLHIAIRKHLWDMLSNLKPSNYEPWILGGDFNCILRNEDRLGGNLNNKGCSKVFNDIVFKNALKEVDYQGQQFTWRRGNLWQRLDRCLMNLRLENLHPNSEVINLEHIGSDHSPLLLRTLAQPTTKKNK
ncbi:uncharacterized protein LOC120207271 [Hibiscus syriacus]|uniref:uncharacterized protein LOC120207271 n=1 Tax=Hibiscus syriacus TaxID=106335 RepID=UPI001922FD01|nr:uncharacterized protein LOC120207271 [Hibiscus syriacus]